MIFAHHAEPQHLPVLAVFLGVGFWLGWHLLSTLFRRADDTKAADHAPPG